MKSKIIKFIASSNDHFIAFDPPVPTKKLIPEWYKKQANLSSDRYVIADNGNSNETVKSCMPVFDMMTAGYTLTLPADVYFKKHDDGSITSHWSTDLISLIEIHPIVQYDSIAVPDGVYPTAFKFVQPWIIETPPGYSTLFINPTFRFDSPFSVLPAIVDTDKHPIPINFPFFLKDGFEGLIEMGTPIMQIIPFKRDDWSHEVGVDAEKLGYKKFQSAKRKISNRYKTFYRTIKRWD